MRGGGVLDSPFSGGQGTCKFSARPLSKWPPLKPHKSIITLLHVHGRYIMHIMLQKLCPLLTEGECQWPGVCLRDRGEAEEGSDTAHSRTL